jgi:hypothetical protein
LRAMARAIRSPRGSGTCRTLQEGVEGLVGLFDLRRGLPGGEEVGEEGGATGGDGLGEGEEEVQQDPHPPASFEVDQAGLPRDLDPGARDGRV